MVFLTALAWFAPRYPVFQNNKTKTDERTPVRSSLPWATFEKAKRGVCSRHEFKQDDGLSACFGTVVDVYEEVFEDTFSTVV